jgi:quercetin dioxygenase-like cupin family protein
VGRVTAESTTESTLRDEGVEELVLVPPQAGSALALATLKLGSAAATAVGLEHDETMLFVAGGSGQLAVDREHHALARGTAALVPAGGAAQLTAGPEGLVCLSLRVGGDVDHHAPLGPHNGCTRATLFMGYIPPGRAPWHYHLYDEIVWVFRGNGALHLGETAEDLAAGSAFRLTPREVHIVENRQEHAELAVLGLFTPAGSPSAAYLPPGTAGAYAFAGTD